ncbi:MAG: hypothetical protein VKO44_07445 [Cyanobacteriota bacterium]|nr:hypothetical protein [Cyanobacteriota bacterium]
MATINVSSSQNIRDAISGGGSFSVPASGDTISIAAGTFNITSTVIPNVPGPGATGPATFAYAAQPNINSVTGFTGPTHLVFSGAGKEGDASVTIITGNSRLYVGNSDGKPPTSLSFSNLDFSYTGAAGYLLQTGVFGNPTSITQSITLNNLSFRGTHLGAGGSDNPKGNYGALVGFNTLSFTNSSVSLTGQNNFNGTSPVSNGSSFLMLQGNSMTIFNNQFNETGYRNALSIFDSTSVTLSNNTFTRDTGSRFVRTDVAPSGTPWLPPIPTPKSNKISKSTGVSVTSNTFANGSFLALEGGSGSVTSNTFNGQNVDISGTYGYPGALGILLETPTSGPITNPNYSVTNNIFRFVSPIVNKTTAISTITGANTFINPANGNSLAIQEFVTGTNASEVVVSSAPATPRSEMLSGGLGNDTLNGGTGNPATDLDYFLFDTAPDTTSNSDTIINFNSNPGGVNRDRLVLSRAIYRDLITTSTVTGGGNNQIGVLAQATSGNNQIFNSGSSVSFTTNTQRIALITSGTQQGELWYDRDGSDGTYSPVRFARIFTDNGVTGLNTVAGLGNVFVI